LITVGDFGCIVFEMDGTAKSVVIEINAKSLKIPEICEGGF
jgi:hypothetical protein